MNLELEKGKYIKANLKVDELKLYDYLVQIYCVIENKVLPFAERTLLCYYIQGGINSGVEQQYMDDFNRSKQAISNLKYSLVKNGFLKKREGEKSHELLPQFKTKRDLLTIIVELDARK